MERHMIDLNKQDFDLNEFPLVDLNVSPHDCFLSSSSSSSPHDVVNTTFSPKKGGWLELFQHMFRQDEKATSVHTVASNDFRRKNPSDVNIIHMDGHHVYTYQDKEKSSKKNFSSLVGKEEKWKKRGNGSFLPFADEVSQFLLQSASRDGLLYMSRSPFEACSTSTIDPCLLALMKCGGSAPHFAYPTFGYDGIGLIDNELGLPSGCDESKAPLNLDLNSHPVSSLDKDPGELCNLDSSNNDFNRIATHSLERKNYYKGMFAQDLNGSVSSNNILDEETKCFQRDGLSDNVKLSDPIMSNNAISERIVRVIESPEWLPLGWVTELKTRKAGTTAGTTDKYFKDPVTGRRFRSKNEVVSFLQKEQRYNHQPETQLFEGLTTVSPELLPCQNYGQASSESGICPHNFLLHTIDGGSDVPSIGSCSTISERISVKREVQEETVQDERTEDVAAVTKSYEIDMQSGLSFWVPEKPKRVHTLLELNKASGLAYKRQKISNSNGLASGHIPSECNTIIARNDSATRWKNETKMSLDGIMKIELLDNEQKLNMKVHDRDRDGGTIQPLCGGRYRANGDLPFLCEAKVVWNASSNKTYERKIPKLTLKQEREVLIALGRKCCLQFLSFASTSSVSERHV